MKASPRKSATGAAKVVKGKAKHKAKQIAGKALGKKLMQVRGRALQLVGKIKKAVAKRKTRKGG